MNNTFITYKISLLPIFIVSAKNNRYYVIATVPYHPFAADKKRISLHRLIIEQKIGRYLSRNKDVHHKNGNGLDNRLCNLELMSHGEHSSLRSGHIRNSKIIDMVSAFLIMRPKLESYDDNSIMEYNENIVVYENIVDIFICKFGKFYPEIISNYKQLIKYKEVTRNGEY